MAYHYINQPARYIIGSASADATLTGAYAGNQATFNTEGFVQATVYIAYTAAEAARTMSIQLEGSPDGVTFYPVASIQDVSPFDGTANSLDFVNTIVSTGASLIKRRFSYPLGDNHIRVSVKEDGANFGTINVILLISGV